MLFKRLVLLLILVFALAVDAQVVNPIASKKANPTPLIPNGVTNFGTVIVSVDDLDGDGLSNEFEENNGLNPNDPSDALLDLDEDGLTNLEEAQLGTDPNDSDSDDDNFSDNEEVFAGTNPLDPLDFPDGPVIIPDLVSLSLTPSTATLTNNTVLGSSPLQLVVTGTFTDDSERDLTADFRTVYTTANPTIVDVTPDGALIGFGEGETTITVSFGAVSTSGAFSVTRFVPEIIGKTNIGGTDGVAIGDGLVFAARGSDIQVFDISDPQSPALTTTLTPGSAINDLHLEGRRLYAAASDQVHIINASGPDFTVLGAAVGDARALDVDGATLAVAGNNGVRLFDVSDPTNPLLTQLLTGSAIDVAIDGDRLYTLTNSQMRVFTQSNGLFQQAGSFSRSGMRAIDAAGDTVFLAVSQPAGLRILDASNPFLPVEISVLANNFNCFDVVHLQGFALLAENRFVNLVPVVNVTDPTAPFLAANPQVTDDADGRQIAVAGNLAVVGTNEGFQLVRWFRDDLGVAPTIDLFEVTPTDLAGGGIVTVSVQASDDVFLADVGLLIDGEVVQSGSAQSLDFQFPTPSVTEETTMTIQARARDGAGRVTLSAVETVTLTPDLTPPVVSFVNPQEGDAIVPNENFLVTIDAQDDVRVDRVELLLDGISQGNDSTPPYEFLLNLPLPEVETPFQLTARALDSNNNESTAVINLRLLSLDGIAAFPTEGFAVGERGYTLSVAGVSTDGLAVIDLSGFATRTLYSSSDESIARVTADGAVSAVGNGVAVIMVQNGALSTEVTVTAAADPDENDQTPPDTDISGLSTSQSNHRFDVPFNLLSGGSDFAGTRLYYRKAGAGFFAPFADQQRPHGVFLESPIPFDASLTGGDGVYEFFTAGLDINGNEEPAPGTPLTVTVDTGQETVFISEDTTISAADFSLDERRLVVDGATLTMDGFHRFASLRLVNGGVVNTVAPSTTAVGIVDIQSPCIIVDSGCAINVDGLGFVGAFQADNTTNLGFTIGNVPVSGTTSDAAGGYGGLGGVETNGTLRVGSYGSVMDPLEPGSGGSAGGASGNGGGVIRIDAHYLEVNGLITSRGSTSSQAAGSGGALNLKTEILAGSGDIRATGGNGDEDGGGGRIAVNFGDRDAFSGDINAAGLDDDENEGSGGAGTVYLRSNRRSFGDLIIDNRDQPTNTISTFLRSVGAGVLDAVDGNTLTDTTANFPIPDPATGTRGLEGLYIQPDITKDAFFPIITNTATTLIVAGDLTEVNAGAAYTGTIPLQRLEVLDQADVQTEDQVMLSNLLVDGAVFRLGGERSVFSQSLELANGATLTSPTPTTQRVFKFHFTSPLISVDASSALTMNGRGFVGAFQGGNTTSAGHTLGNLPITGLTSDAAGSHGGLGGLETSGRPQVATYGDVRRPVQPGAGGSAGGASGNGGGVIHLIVDTLDVAGRVSADGGGSSQAAGGGGSVLIEVTNLSGAGVIRANGGNGDEDGGGGRVAVYYENRDLFTGDIQAFGNDDDEPEGDGGAGTVFLKAANQLHGTLIVDNDGGASFGLTTPLRSVGAGFSTSVKGNVLTDDNASFPVPDAATGALGLVGLQLLPNSNQTTSFTITDNTATTLTVDGDLSAAAQNGDPYSGVRILDDIQVSGNARVQLLDGVSADTLTVDAATFRLGGHSSAVSQSIQILNSGILDSPFPSTTRVFKQKLTTPLLFVDAGSNLSVNDRGFLGAFRGDNNSSQGRTLGNLPVEGLTSDAAGSHGGIGGLETSGRPQVATYGDLFRPTQPGSGGSSGGASGNGGGVIHVVADSIEVNGFISANGGGSSQAAGAGGSILLEVGTLSGTGLIRANGGNGDEDGGGGRIAIYYTNRDGFSGEIQAFGNNDDESEGDSGAGTIFLKSDSQAFGSLFIDNEGTPSEGFTTPLRSVGASFSTDLTAAVLTDDTADFPVANAVTGALGLVGLFLNPNAEQNQRFVILSNTATTITVKGDMSAVATAGDPYHGVLMLDELEITGKAKPELRDGLSVTSLSLDDAPFRLGGHNSSITNALSLTNSATLDSPFPSTRHVFKQVLTADTISVDGTSAISVADRGFLGAFRGDNNTATGRTLGNLPIPGLTTDTAGSHGGIGGLETAGRPRVPAYGDMFRPLQPGSGGSQAGACGNGGGVVHITAGSLTVDGVISADGGSLSAGGAGGSILLEVETLSGSGVIRANGGNGDEGGGGGRIAVYHTNRDKFTGSFQAFGDDDDEPEADAGAGTIFLRDDSQSFGSLIINNNGTSSQVISTPLRSVGPSISTGLTATVLTDSTAAFPVPDPTSGALGLVGLMLNPNTAQSQVFTITDNTATTLTVQGDMSAVAGVGNPYSGVLLLDDLTISGLARPELIDQVSVTDLSVDNATLRLGGHGSNISGSLSLTNGGVLDSPLSSTTRVFKQKLTTPLITVDATSKISAAGRGFLGSFSGDNNTSAGRTLGNVPITGLTTDTAGSHGGLGGLEIAGRPQVATYGDFKRPIQPGAGGSTSITSASGGGVVHLVVDTLNLEGELDADGGSTSQAGGGGGSILLEVGTLTGAGSIHANGGDGDESGGGGRVAVYYTNRDLYTGSFQAFGENDDEPEADGGAGTVFLKSGKQTHGDLIIDNNDVVSQGFTTPLRGIARGSSSTLDASSLTDVGASFALPDPATGALGVVGLEVSANLNQNTLVEVTNNSATSLTLAADVTATATAGDPYIGVYTFDSMTVRGQANVETVNGIVVLGGAPVVESGTLSSGDTAPLNRGSLNIEQGELVIGPDDPGIYGRILVRNGVLRLGRDIEVEELVLVDSQLGVATGQRNIGLTVSGDTHIDAGSVISVSGVTPALNSTTPGAGGGYGGGTALYGRGNPLRPQLPGFGGADGPVLTDPNQADEPIIGRGGLGGGSLQLETKNLILDGVIEAVGRPGKAPGGGSGAGGSVWLTVRQTFSGRGVILANGGSRLNRDDMLRDDPLDSHTDLPGGGGEGGRIAVHAETSSFTGEMHAEGGFGSIAGRAGSVYTRYGDRNSLQILGSTGSLSTLGPVLRVWTDGLRLAGQVYEPNSLTGMLLGVEDATRPDFLITGNEDDLIFIQPLHDHASLPAVTSSMFLVRPLELRDVYLPQHPNGPTVAGQYSSTTDFDLIHPMAIPSHLTHTTDLTQKAEPLVIDALEIAPGLTVRAPGELVLRGDGGTTFVLRERLRVDHLRLEGIDTLIVDRSAELSVASLESNGLRVLDVAGRIRIQDPDAVLQARLIELRRGARIQMGLGQADDDSRGFGLIAHQLKVDSGATIHVGGLSHPMAGRDHDFDGGLLHIRVAHMLLDGRLVADGGSLGRFRGSGGRVVIQSQSLQGSGAISIWGGQAMDREDPWGPTGWVDLDVETLEFKQQQILSERPLSSEGEQQ